MVKSSVPQDKSPSDSSDVGCRPTFYMTAELLEALEAQCAVEGNRKRSPFLAEILELLLTSDVGQTLRESAQKHRRPLLHELEANLILFNEHIPTERIVELAEASQRNPDQMLVRLVLLGLRIYERAVSLMESDIEGRQS
ncbi:hypothetical protein IQ254_06955 [Nodosilinea sp. LEGE 07088]|uniref:hypothetical protein n=1 Tax=unclassified Nodosilinea TaxID=2628167 RepID=UPI00187F69F5|nr:MULTISPECIES: hypothetical protein [unclassified Nodosilinea]MBE9136941.1 hypothetical protein [Nodosilinea sp. LEGE 07088]MDF0369679.1 hypothetical protein [Nodosilinea sp. TSF1-S3]